MALTALQVCRTCMQERQSVVNLFELIKDNSYLSPITFADLLKICTPVQAIQEDGLPQGICECCSKFLLDTYDFRNKCEKSDEVLRNSFIKLNENIVIKSDTKNDTLLEDNKADIFKEDVIQSSNRKPKTKPHIYNCNDCSKQFTDVKKIEKHVKLHFKNKNYQCQLCNKRFFTTFMLSKHSVEHSEEGCLKKIETKHHIHLSLKCFKCDERFSSNKALSDHVVHRHNNSDTSNDSRVQPNVHRKKDKLYNCRYCKRYFKQLHSLNVHIRTHTKETPFLCCTCGKSFGTDSNLKEHMFRHSGLCPFACHLCPKKFNTKGTLTSHVKTHVNIQPYVCDTCGRSFTSPSNLKKHKSIHIGAERWECYTCKKRFSKKEHLKRHILIHTGEKPHKCEYCDKAFNQKFNLSVHTRLHVGKNIYNCTLCDEKFRLSSELKQHYSVHFVNNPTNLPSTNNVIVEEK